MKRDFTYIDDIVDGVVATLDRPAMADATFDRFAPNPGTSQAPFRVFNIGNHSPVELGTFIETLEDAIGQKAIKEYKPMQPGDVEATYADVDSLKMWTEKEPHINLKNGINKFISWYKIWRK